VNEDEEKREEVGITTFEVPEKVDIQGTFSLSLEKPGGGQEIDTSWTDLVTCPYCGYEDRDSWDHEFGDGQLEIECEECQKKFTAVRYVVIYYSSRAHASL